MTDQPSPNWHLAATFRKVCRIQIKVVKNVMFLKAQEMKAWGKHVMVVLSEDS